MWNLNRGQRGAIMLGAALGAATPVMASGANLTIEIGNQPAVMAVQPGIELAVGEYRYIGHATGIGGASLNWNIVATEDTSRGPALLQGQVVAHNPSQQNVFFAFRIEWETCPHLLNMSLIGGLSSLRLTTDTGGGAATLNEGAVWRLFNDGQESAALFAAPFSLTATGAGTGSATQTIGTPFPSLPGPPLTDRAGLEVRVWLTGGEEIQFTNLAFFGEGDESEFQDCNIGDVNGDGIIGVADLLELLALWGNCPQPCDADFDDDGTVSVSDLLALIGAWEEG